MSTGKRHKGHDGHRMVFVHDDQTLCYLFKYLKLLYNLGDSKNSLNMTFAFCKRVFERNYFNCCLKTNFQ